MGREISKALEKGGEMEGGEEMSPFLSALARACKLQKLYVGLVFTVAHRVEKPGCAQ